MLIGADAVFTTPETRRRLSVLVPAPFKCACRCSGGENAAIAVFQAPDDVTLRDPAGVQNFAANLRVFTEKGFSTPFDRDMPALAVVEPGTPNIPRTFLDGTSNTIALATKLAECGAGGSRYAADPTSPWAAFIGQHAAKHCRT